MSFFVFERNTDQLDYNIDVYYLYLCLNIVMMESLSLSLSLFLSCLLSFLCLFDENLIKAVFAKYNGLDQTLDTTHTCFITNSNHTGIKKTLLWSHPRFTTP